MSQTAKALFDENALDMRRMWREVNVCSRGDKTIDANDVIARNTERLKRFMSGDALKKRAEGWAADYIAGLDLDKDGVINQDEFVRYYARTALPLEQEYKLAAEESAYAVSILNKPYIISDERKAMIDEKAEDRKTIWAKMNAETPGDKKMDLDDLTAHYLTSFGVQQPNDALKKFARSMAEGKMSGMDKDGDNSISQEEYLMCYLPLTCSGSDFNEEEFNYALSLL